MPVPPPLLQFRVDAFTDELFGGNPACVVPLEEWLPDDIMLKIAGENAAAQTAFFIKSKQGFDLRWFTPEIEMDLCGHATMATAHVLREHLSDSNEVFLFNSKAGPLSVSFADGMYTLDFPKRDPAPATLPRFIADAISAQPLEVLRARDYLLAYHGEGDVKNLSFDPQLINQENLGTAGIIVTAQGVDVDFVSRFFSPQARIFEDPVTASSHCSLIPYWGRRLNKTRMAAKQVSSRGGKLLCDQTSDRVLISGKARTFCEGMIYLD